MTLTNKYENQYWSTNNLVLGIDEVGRGPLCGPLVVAGVVLPINYSNDNIKDSKKLSYKKIEELYNIIIKDAISYYIEIIPPKQIDQLNIYQATKQGMINIINKSSINIILVDAIKIESKLTIHSIVKGDQQSISIAAASIIAKYTRDNIMIEYHKQYPNYGYHKHKGYPTKEHLIALNTYGLNPLYRLSYKPCQKYL